MMENDVLLIRVLLRVLVGGLRVGRGGGACPGKGMISLVSLALLFLQIISPGMRKQQFSLGFINLLILVFFVFLGRLAGNRAQWFPYYRREIFSEHFREKH